MTNPISEAESLIDIEGDDVCSFNQGSIFNYCSLASPGPCQPQESGGVRFVMIYSNS